MGEILGNASDLRTANRDTGPADFLLAAWERLGASEFASSAVVDLAQEHLFLGEGSDREVAHRLGNRLREFIDRPLGGLVLRRSEGTTGDARRWHIERV